jgi:hypothetical protein
VADDRAQLRETFDSAARPYPQARPEYPDQLFDALGELARLQPGSRLVEVAARTGKATLPLARRGYRITCRRSVGTLATARTILAGFPQLDVIESAFEDWSTARATPSSSMCAATAWHQLDPAVP